MEIGPEEEKTTIVEPVKDPVKRPKPVKAPAKT